MSQLYTKDKEGAVLSWPMPSKPVGYSGYLQYKAILREIFKEQQSTYHVSITNVWEHVWTSDFDNVRDHVNNRK